MLLAVVPSVMAGSAKAAFLCGVGVEGNCAQMVEITPLDVDLHLSDIVDLAEEYLSWIAGEVQERYAIDAVAHGRDC